jgi:DNA-binding transcriptional LysR family regulator
MELRNMITFQHICQLKSFSKAAAELGYSQSAVTVQIKQLEDELNVKLFDRVGKTIQITNEGYRLLKYTGEIITATQNAIADLSSNSVPNGVLRIGVLESVCTAYLPQVLSLYHARYPQVSTVIQTGTFDELSSMLNSNFIDLLWTFDQSLVVPEWQKAYSYENRIEVVCSQKHPLAQSSEVTLSNLAEETFILTEQNCSYRRIFEECMLTLGYHPSIFLEIGNTEMIKKFVEANLGITVLPHFTLTEELAVHKLHILNVKDFDLQMQGQVFYHKSKWLSPVLDSFLDLVKECSFT